MRHSLIRACVPRLVGKDVAVFGHLLTETLAHLDPNAEMFEWSNVFAESRLMDAVQSAAEELTLLSSSNGLESLVDKALQLDLQVVDIDVELEEVAVKLGRRGGGYWKFILMGSMCQTSDVGAGPHPCIYSNFSYLVAVEVQQVIGLPLHIVDDLVQVLDHLLKALNVSVLLQRRKLVDSGEHLNQLVQALGKQVELHEDALFIEMELLAGRVLSQLVLRQLVVLAVH